MKKMAYLLSLTLIASLSFFSCDNAEDNEAPTVTNIKVNGTAVTGGAFTALAGKVSISFTVSDDNEVSKVTVAESGSSKTEFSNDKVAKSTAEISFDYTVSKTVNLIITVTDDKDKTVSSTLSVSLDAGVNSYSAKLLGGQDNASSGSFLATSNGTVYLQADAKANSGLVDILYFYGATNEATLAAPSDADAATIFNNGTTGLQTWTTKNATSFKTTTLALADFNALNLASGAESAYNAGTSVSTKANKLVSGKVVAFKTAAGKYGLVYVSALTTGATGSITLDVKVGK